MHWNWRLRRWATGVNRISLGAAFLLGCAHAQTVGVVAYTRTPEGAAPWPQQDICTIRTDGTGGRCLTDDRHSHHPVWSPDGKRILFIHDSTLSTKPLYRETEEGRSHHPIELSVMDADGRNRRVLRTIEPVIHSAAWSPDGRTLAVSAATPVKAGEPVRTGIFLLPADGRGELRLLKPDAWTPAWSPDGAKLAFSVEQPRGRWAVHTANVDGTGDTRLTDPGVNSESPAWSPNGARIVFGRLTDGAMGQQQVFIMNRDGSGVRQVTTNASWACGYSTWSTGGNQLVVACRSATSPCGWGMVFSTGQPMPACSRRLFVIRLATAGNAATARMLMDHDGIDPALAPR